jgi:CRP-like cAMP-binding protein
MSPSDSTSRACIATQHAHLAELIERALPGTGRATVQRLAEIARIRRGRPGETLFRQGEALPMTLVVRGHAAYRRTTDSGQEITVGIASPGDLFGLGSVTCVISPVDLVPLVDIEAAFWQGTAIRRLASVDPGFAVAAIGRLSLSLNIITEKVDGFLHQDARRRVLRVLDRHRDLFFTEPPVLSRSHLPGLVGTTREMTGRVIRQLEREGTIARVGRTGLRLLRPDQLDA